MDILKDIVDLLRWGKLEQAESMIKNSLFEPNLESSIKLNLELLYGELLFRKGQFQEVIKNLSKTQEMAAQQHNLDVVFHCNFLIANSNIRIGALDKGGKIISEMQELLNLTEIKSSIDFKSKKADYLLIKAIHERYKSEFHSALEFYDKCISIRNELNDRYGTAEPWNHIGIIYDQLGDHVNALEAYKVSIKIYEEENDVLQKIGVMNNMGLIYWQTGDLSKALDIYLSGLEISRESKSERAIIPFLINIGLVCIDLGSFNESRKYFNESLKIFEKMGNKKGIIVCNLNLGIIHDLQWEYEEALEHYKISIAIAEEIDEHVELLKLYINVGITYNNLNNQVESILYFKKAIDVNRVINNEFFQGKILYHLVRVMIDNNQHNVAQKYFEEFTDLVKKTKNEKVLNLHQLSKALILKSKSGLRNRANSSMILSEIVRKDNITYEDAMVAIVNLCEILVTEVQVTKNEEDLEEINFLLKKLETLSSENPSPVIKVNILLLKSRISFMFEKINEAIHFIDTADEIAKSSNVNSLIIRVEEERNYLEQTATVMQNVGLQASERLNLIQKRNIEYIDFLKKNYKGFEALN